MEFAVPVKGAIPSIVRDALYRGGSLRMLQSLLSSSPPLSKSNLRISRLQLSARPIKHRVAACSNDQGLDVNCSRRSSPSSKEALLDIKLPRRNLIVQFTCNSCGKRTQRQISRVAYEHGTIFVQVHCALFLTHPSYLYGQKAVFTHGNMQFYFQNHIKCAGCLVKHKLVDNLGLVVEYDLQENLDADSNGTR